MLTPRPSSRRKRGRVSCRLSWSDSRSTDSLQALGRSFRRAGLLGVIDVDRPEAVGLDVEEVDAVAWDLDRFFNCVRLVLVVLFCFVFEEAFHLVAVAVEQRDLQGSPKRV